MSNGRNKKACTHEKRPYACNSITRSVCSQLSVCIGKLPNIAPKFDQIFISVRTNDNAYALFKEKFGMPTGKFVDADTEYWKFRNGICLSQRKEYSYYTIRLEVTDSRLSDLHGILQKLNPLHGNKPVAMLQSAELAWDIPLYGTSYKKAECIFHQLIKVLIPKNTQARLHSSRGKKQKTRDGAINGECTYYFEKRILGSDGKFTRAPSQSWHAKAYLKHMSKTWHIRIEIRLRNASLAKRITKGIPTQVFLTTENVYAALNEYFLLAEFNWASFADTATRIAHSKKVQKMLTVITLLKYSHNKTASQKKRVALLIASLVQSDYLKRRIGRGGFYRRVKLFRE